jgi:hypothetical protein
LLNHVIRHKLGLNIPDIWEFLQQFATLQRQIIKKFRRYEDNEIIGSIGHWFDECYEHEGSEPANAGVPR